MKLIYPDGTVVETVVQPANFTGIIKYDFFNCTTYYSLGLIHNSKGLPAINWKSGRKEYFIEGNKTGQFWSGR
jgi:hypothetical protein